MKEIRFGILDGSIGDAITLLPVINNSKFTLEVSQLNSRSEILKLNCHRIFLTEKPLLERDSIEIFGRPEKRNDRIHACINFVNMFGVNTKDYIPKLKFNDTELFWASEYTTQFSKPVVCFCPVVANHKTKPSVRMQPFELWEMCMSDLAKRTTILYCCREEDYIPVSFEHQKTFHLSARQIGAILNVCKRYIGIDTGIKHLAVASGAKAYVVVPTFGLADGYCFPAYGYDLPMWSHEPCRSFYYLLNSSANLFKRFYEDWSNILCL